MAQYSASQNDPVHHQSTDLTRDRTSPSHESPSIASPAPLGLGMIGIVTAILGCFFANFIIPFGLGGIRAGVGSVLAIGAIILVLAGMWEFRKGHLLTASTFTSYGGFLGILGLIFLPFTGIIPALGGSLFLFLGLLFLCWTIYLIVLAIGSSRTDASLMSVLIFLTVAYFFLMLGSFAGGNIVLLRIGGWFAIASAIVSWLASLASILRSETGHEAYHLPLSNRLATE